MSRRKRGVVVTQDGRKRTSQSTKQQSWMSTWKVLKNFTETRGALKGCKVVFLEGKNGYRIYRVHFPNGEVKMYSVGNYNDIVNGIFNTRTVPVEYMPPEAKLAYLYGRVITAKIKSQKYLHIPLEYGTWNHLRNLFNDTPVKFIVDKGTPVAKVYVERFVDITDDIAKRYIRPFLSGYIDALFYQKDSPERAGFSVHLLYHREILISAVLKHLNETIEDKLYFTCILDEISNEMTIHEISKRVALVNTTIDAVYISNLRVEKLKDMAVSVLAPSSWFKQKEE